MSSISPKSMTAPKKTVGWRQIYTLLDLLYWSIVRPIYKWCLHVWSGKSEIERILDSLPPGAARTKAIERSLARSRHPELRQVAYAPVESFVDAVGVVVRAKAVPSQLRQRVEAQLAVVLAQILGYNQLTREVEWARAEKYSAESDEHERTLIELWSLLRPEETLTGRTTKQWQKIGFQGDNPSTDFRGMGYLGLTQLHFLAQKYPQLCQRIYSISLHPKIGFPYAIAGMSMTALARDLQLTGVLKTHFFNSLSGPPAILDFNRVYCTLFAMFCEKWQHSDVESVMEFNRIREAFQFELTNHLADNTHALPTMSLH